MPNIASAKKRTRTTAKRTAINHSRKTRVRGYVRKVEEAPREGRPRRGRGGAEKGGA